MPNSFAESSDGVLLIADGVSPVLRWDGTGVARPAGIAPPATAPVISAGEPAGGGSGVTGQYQAYVRFLDADGLVSDLSPPSNLLLVTGAGGIDYSGLPAPQSGRVVLRQILRNTAGQFATFYVDIESADVTADTASSTRTDQELLAQEAQSLFAVDGEVLANRHAVPPTTKPYLAFHLTRMWAAGEVSYAEGSISTVPGEKDALRGFGTEWTAAMAGRQLHLSGSPPLDIVAVDEQAQSLTLDTLPGGPPDRFAAYAIKPFPAEAALLYFSEAGRPESWPAVNALPLPEDGDVVTGLMTKGSFLYVLKRRHVYRVTAQEEPSIDAGIFLTCNRGCVNHRCFATADQVTYVLDEGGVYAFDGSDAPRSVSDNIQPMFQADWPGTRINWSASRFFHAVANTRQAVVRWFVCLAGDYLPRHAICYAYNAEKWWVEEYASPVGCSAAARLGRPTGTWATDQEETVLGGHANRVLVAGLDPLDLSRPGVAGGVLRAGLATLTDGAARFPALANVPVAITDGRGAGQVRVVVSNTSNTLHLDRPWAVRPDETSRYAVGGIRYTYLSSRFRYLPREDREEASVEILHTPSPGAVARLGLRHDFSGGVRQGFSFVGQGYRGEAEEPYVTIDLARTAGATLVRFDRSREATTDGPRFVQVGVSGVSVARRVTFGEMLIRGLV